MKNEKYIMPSGIKGQLFRTADSDSLHFMQSGEPLYLVTGRRVEKTRYALDGVATSSDGVKPLNTEKEKYPEVASRYSANYIHDAGRVVSPGLLCGADFVNTPDAKAYVAGLLDREEIVPVGSVDGGLGGIFGSLTFKYTITGIDAMINLEAFTAARLVMVRGAKGIHRPEAGKLILTGPKFLISLNSAAVPSNVAGAGWLLSETMVGNFESMQANGLDVIDGGTLDTVGIHLTEEAAAVLRDMAVLERSAELYPENKSKAFR